jgi:hypothetical protein
MDDEISSPKVDYDIKPRNAPVPGESSGGGFGSSIIELFKH